MTIYKSYHIYYSQIIFLTLLTILLSGCFEIDERISIQKNGSGSYEMTFNLSKLRSQLNASDDSSKALFRQKLIEAEKTLRMRTRYFEQLDGISEVAVIVDRESFVFGYRFAFDDVRQLNRALVKTNPDGFMRTFQFPYRRRGRRKLEVNPVFQPETLLGSLLPLGRTSQTPDHLLPYLDSAYQTMQYQRIIAVSKKIRKHNNNNYELNSEGNALRLKMPVRDLIEKPDHLSNRIKFK